MNLLNRKPREWHPPHIEQPTRVLVDNLTEIGRDRRGRVWYAHKQFGELAERGHVEPDDEVPTALLLPAGDAGWTVLEAHAPGTFEARQAAVAPTVKAPKPPRPVDALAGNALLAGRAELLFASASTIAAPSLGARPDGYFRAGRADARGAASIVERLRAKGIVVRLSIDGSSLVVLAPGGRAAGAAEVVAVAGPLLLAFLQGAPLRCRVTDHDVEAVTVAVGGTPYCGECV